MSISKIEPGSKVSNTDLAKMVQEVHDCVHSFQKDMGQKLEGHQIILSGQISQVRDMVLTVENKVSNVDSKVNTVDNKVNTVDANVRSLESRTSRIEGVQSTVYGVKTSSEGVVTLDKVKKNILTLPLYQAFPLLLGLVVAGSGTYKLLVALAETLHHYLMTAAK